MQIKYSPQRADNQISYQFDGEKVIATLNGETDIIDLSAIEQYPEFEESRILTRLSVNPVVSVRTENGIKKVELLKFHGVNAPESERFGFDWEDVEQSGASAT